MDPSDSNELQRRARELQLLLLDVDGVLTDGGLVLAGQDLEAKRFDVQDGMGITLLQHAGVEIGIITGRVSHAVRRRAEELSIDRVHQGHFWKDRALDEVLEEGYAPERVGYVGDDVQDLCVLQRVGMPLAPNNARPAVKETCVYVAEAAGGAGALREIADWLLTLRGQKERLVRLLSRGSDAAGEWERGDTV